MEQAVTPQTIQIKHWSGRVLYECEIPAGVESGLALRHALEKATAARIVLSGAVLRGAVLSGAVLSGAVLSGADLSGADLSGADLSGAVLSGAVLSGAVLSGAVLSGAVLSGANLSCAVLRGAVLRGAVLSCADLSGADLSCADLSEMKADFFDVLLRAPREIAGLRAALVEGRVDGSTYEGACACLVGTIANVRHANYQELGAGISPNSSRPAERWFMGIRKGDTPEINQISKITVEWLDEFVGLLAAATPATADEKMS